MEENRFLYQKNVKTFFLDIPVSRKSAFYVFFQTISDIIVLPFLEDLGEMISVPVLKVAISGGKVERPSKPYICGKIDMWGSMPAEIGCLNTILSHIPKVLCLKSSIKGSRQRLSLLST